MPKRKCSLSGSLYLEMSHLDVISHFIDAFATMCHVLVYPRGSQIRRFRRTCAFCRKDAGPPRRNPVIAPGGELSSSAFIRACACVCARARAPMYAWRGKIKAGRKRTDRRVSGRTRSPGARASFLPSLRGHLIYVS